MKRAAGRSMKRRRIPHAGLRAFLLSALLLIVPAFGNGPDDPTSVSLLALSGVSTWIRVTFAACIGTTVLCGICEIAASRTDASWGKAALVAGIGLLAASLAVFILARQPYAGITCFALLATKSLLLWRRDH